MDEQNDIYAELKSASSEELLEAAINAYQEFNPTAERWIRLGFRLAGSDGWREVAPAWLRDIREGDPDGEGLDKLIIETNKQLIEMLKDRDDLHLDK